MARHSNTEDQLVGTAKDVMNQNLDRVESGVDTAIDSTKEAVHELRNEAEEVVDRTLNRVKGAWEGRRPSVEQYMDSHPWVVIGGLLLLAYLFSRAQRMRPE
jgi:ElaB/YqjD/DUF883 family membrane-anchored ribosome-binding protein